MEDHPHLSIDNRSPRLRTNETKANPHPAVKQLLGFFKCDDLPEHLRAVSKPFAELASMLVRDIPSNAELTVGLRKLLEAKDCCVRAQQLGSQQAPSNAPPPAPPPGGVRKGI